MATTKSGHRGRPAMFGPVHRRTTITLTRFADDVLSAATSRSGRADANVIELLIRKFGGTITEKDFEFPEGDCGAAAVHT